MAITIPETMPEDWFGEAEADRGTIANDPALRHAMEAAYQDGLEAMEVDGIMGKLKDRCMAAAKASTSAQPQEDASDDHHTSRQNPTNHHLTAESVTAGSETT